MNPLARQDNLVIEEIWDEVVVYDKNDNQVHRLNGSAAMVWRHCDGARSVADLAAVLHERMSLPHDESLVRLALADLEQANLLAEPLPVMAGAAISRREMLEHLKVAAFMLPVVASVLAVPSTAAASTPTSPGSTVPVFPKVGTYAGVLSRGSASCNGDYSATSSVSCSMSSNLQTCTITETGEPTRVCTAASAPASGVLSPTATYTGSGLLFGSFSGTWSVTATWSTNTSCTFADSRTITGSAGCPAVFTGVCTTN